MTCYTTFIFKLQRIKQNPILTPSNRAWENLSVFNPGVVWYKGHILLLYRAVGTQDQISRIGKAKSLDGINFLRKDFPIYYGGEDKADILGIEDIRAVQIENTYYLVYAAVSPRKLGKSPTWKDTEGRKPQIALSTTKNFKDFRDFDVIIPHIEGKDASLFPRKIDNEFVLLYREGPDKTFIARSHHFDYWPKRYFLFDKRPGFWDSYRAGIGAPPIETEKGWLLFYHGVDDKNVYRLGIMFLDLDDPRKILYRSPEPVLEPETAYERHGYTPNVVFTCGAVEKDGQYFVYYGAADEVIALATVSKQDVLRLL